MEVLLSANLRLGLLLRRPDPSAEEPESSWHGRRGGRGSSTAPIPSTSARMDPEVPLGNNRRIGRLGSSSFKLRPGESRIGGSPDAQVISTTICRGSSGETVSACWFGPMMETPWKAVRLMKVFPLSSEPRGSDRARRCGRRALAPRGGIGRRAGGSGDRPNR